MFAKPKTTYLNVLNNCMTALVMVSFVITTIIPVQKVYAQFLKPSAIPIVPSYSPVIKTVRVSFYWPGDNDFVTVQQIKLLGIDWEDFSECQWVDSVDGHWDKVTLKSEDNIQAIISRFGKTMSQREALRKLLQEATNHLSSKIGPDGKRLLPNISIASNDSKKHPLGTVVRYKDSQTDKWKIGIVQDHLPDHPEDPRDFDLHVADRSQAPREGVLNIPVTVQWVPNGRADSKSTNPIYAEPFIGSVVVGDIRKGRMILVGDNGEFQVIEGFNKAFVKRGQLVSGGDMLGIGELKVVASNFPIYSQLDMISQILLGLKKDQGSKFKYFIHLASLCDHKFIMKPSSITFI